MPLPEHIQRALDLHAFATKANNIYWTREEARHRVPQNVDFEEAWRIIERQRLSAPVLPLLDQANQLFRMSTNPKIQELLHRIDTRGVDSMFDDLEGSLRIEIIAETLISEAFSSSQIEGAVTTFAIAAQLAKEERPPKTKDEQMVLNNYRAMQWLLNNRGRPINEELILTLHSIITKDAFDGPDGYVGRFRDGEVQVKRNATDEIVYTAPPAAEIQDYIRTLRGWLADSTFLHPVIQASVVHFYFVYIHPFFDGNGRTARALFYHSLLSHGYDSFRYLSISSVIHHQRGRYYAAIERSEDERDLTPFVLFSCEVVSEAIESVRKRLTNEFATKRLEERLADRGHMVNERQARLLKRCLKNPNRRITIRDHQNRTGSAYETARRDVMELEELGLIKQIGKKRKTVLYALNEAFFL